MQYNYFITNFKMRKNVNLFGVIIKRAFDGYNTDTFNDRKS